MAHFNIFQGRALSFFGLEYAVGLIQETYCDGFFPGAGETQGFVHATGS